MVNKSILTKIEPIDATEKYFYEALSKSKVLDARGLACSLMNENMLYAEAFAFAKSAIIWMEDFEQKYSKFESKAKFVAKLEEEKFLSYCNKKDWSVKKTTKDIIAREKSKFKAKFELETNKVYMIVEDNPLERMQLLNELEVI